MNKCPMCGYTEVSANKVKSNVMNIYINKTNPEMRVCLNELAEEHTIGTEVYVRSDIHEARVKAAADKKEAEEALAKAKTVSTPATPVTPKPVTNPPSK